MDKVSFLYCNKSMYRGASIKVFNTYTIFIKRGQVKRVIVAVASSPLQNLPPIPKIKRTAIEQLSRAYHVVEGLT